jgi:hypothetical protein
VIPPAEAGWRPCVDLESISEANRKIARRNTVLKRDRTTQQNLAIRYVAAAIWLGCFQNANLKPKLACTKFFTEELKLC